LSASHSSRHRPFQFKRNAFQRRPAMEIPHCRYFPWLGGENHFSECGKKNGEKNNKQLLPPGADEENFSV